MVVTDHKPQRVGQNGTVFYNVYVFLWAFSKDPRIVTPAKKSVPKNPIMVLVFPTNRVEEEMASFTVVLALMGLDETVAGK
jgi:hypothetical protein